MTETTICGIPIWPFLGGCLLGTATIIVVMLLGTTYEWLKGK